VDSGAPVEVEPDPLLVVEPMVSPESLVSSVVDVRDWLGEDGRLPVEPRLRARVLRVAHCIEAECRDDRLHALCPTCQTDEFMIDGWQDTDWADGSMEPILARDLFESFEQDPAMLRAFDRLERVLASMGSSLSASAVVHMLVDAGVPVDVVGLVMESLTEPPPQPLIEQLIALLLELRPATG
jgi:hypothetical protein